MRRRQFEHIPSASFSENLRYNLYYVIPLALQGAFTRNRIWVNLFTRLQRDPGAVRFYQELRRKYDCEFVYVRLFRTRSIVVLSERGVRHVLARSPYTYADGRTKRDGMNHFQPGAVTISRGREWDDRRRFNDLVLGYQHSIHQLGDTFAQIAKFETQAATRSAGQVLRWVDFDNMFGRITRQILFGKSARNDYELTGLLRHMMRQANRPLRIRSHHFHRFYRKVGTYLGAATRGDPTLAGMCVAIDYDEAIRPKNQIAHWMFAMWETLAINTARALALIVTDTSAEQRARQELAAVDVGTAEGVDRLKYLEGCVQEAMRLWPSTPMIVREAIEDDCLGGDRIPYGMQVLIPNSLHHRDDERCPFADVFAPDSWAAGSPNVLFNHLSSGPQECAGKQLALYIAKAVLANLLATARYRLLSPSLSQSHKLPRALNHFALKFAKDRPYKVVQWQPVSVRS